MADLFAFGGITGARESECLGLVWSDLNLDDVEDARVAFTFQVDRQGHRVPLKTDESRRTVELPPTLRLMLLAQGSVPDSGSAAFVFATRSGRAIGQRNVLRALRRAQTAARTPEGLPRSLSCKKQGLCHAALSPTSTRFATRLLQKPSPRVKR